MSRYPSRIFVTLLTALAIAQNLPAQQGHPEIPLRAAAQFVEGADVWVSARAISDPVVANWSFLQWGGAPQLQEKTETEQYAQGGCADYGPVEVTLAPGSTYPFSVEALVEQARGIYLGTVVGRDHGFFNSRPGTLLQIEVGQEILPSEDLASLPYLYYFYSAGTFEAAGNRICANDPRLPPVPETGSRALVIGYAVPKDKARSMLSDPFQSIFLATPSGALRAPTTWQEDIAKRGLETFDDVVGYIDRLAGEAER